MTQELFEAKTIEHLEPAGTGVVCPCGTTLDWMFWPTVLNFQSGCVAGPTALCGTRENPGLFAYKILIWAYCTSCKRFFGGIFESH